MVDRANKLGTVTHWSLIDGGVRLVARLVPRPLRGHVLALPVRRFGQRMLLRQPLHIWQL